MFYLLPGLPDNATTSIGPSFSASYQQKLPCSLALSSGVPIGSGTSSKPEVLQSMLGIECPFPFLYTWDQSAKDTLPNPWPRYMQMHRCPPTYPKHFVSSQWNSGAWPFYAQIPFCSAALSSYLWQACQGLGPPWCHLIHQRASEVSILFILGIKYAQSLKVVCLKYQQIQPNKLHAG